MTDGIELPLEDELPPEVFLGTNFLAASARTGTNKIVAASIQKIAGYFLIKVL